MGTPRHHIRDIPHWGLNLVLRVDLTFRLSVPEIPGDYIQKGGMITMIGSSMILLLSGPDQSLSLEHKLGGGGCQDRHDPA